MSVTSSWTSILSIKIQHLPTLGQMGSHVTYRQRNHLMSSDQVTWVMENLDSKWTNENDKLYTYRVTSDDDGNIQYECEMLKHVFDFRTREYRDKVYRKEVTVEERDYLYNFFKDAYSKFIIESIDDFYNNVMVTVGDRPLVATRLVEIRNELLRDSDKYMLIDFPISDEERQKWIDYRAELRSLTEQTAYPYDFANIVLPVAPDSVAQFDILKNYMNVDGSLMNELGPAFMQTGIDSMVRGFVNASTKLEILKVLSDMKIPVFVEQNMSAERIQSLSGDMNEAMRQMEDFQNIVEQNPLETEQEWTDAIAYLDAKLAGMDEKLAEFNLGFTVSDILTQVIEDSRHNAEAQEIVEGL